MELVEKIEDINRNLERQYGRAFNNQANFRVVWANDQYEKRWVSQTEDGFDLMRPEVRELPKYKGADWRGFHILERLIPIVGQTDLTEQISYEPCWVFRDKDHNILPPRYDACCIIIDSLIEASGRKTGFAKYTDPRVDPNYRKHQIDEMQKLLFGNETDTGDSLAYKEGVTVPEMPKQTVSDETKEI